MKTEPTELNKKEPVLAVNHMVDWTDEGKSVTTDVCYKWLKIAFKDGQSNPNIKQLEWVEVWEGYEDAKTPFGHYVVRPSIDNRVFLMVNPRKIIQPYSTLSEAKAAAQRDFEKRIKECLVVE
jgi:hypothetical protein